MHKRSLPRRKKGSRAAALVSSSRNHRSSDTGGLDRLHRPAPTRGTQRGCRADTDAHDEVTALAVLMWTCQEKTQTTRQTASVLFRETKMCGLSTKTKRASSTRFSGLQQLGYSGPPRAPTVRVPSTRPATRGHRQFPSALGFPGVPSGRVGFLSSLTSYAQKHARCPAPLPDTCPRKGHQLSPLCM